MKHPTQRRLLVSEINGAGFQRLFGGKIEFGERSDEALAREFQEELGIEVVVGDLLGVLQNRFSFNDAPGHEIVLVHAVELIDQSLYTTERLPRLDRSDGFGSWRLLDDPPDIPLYAEGWQTLIPG